MIIFKETLPFDYSQKMLYMISKKNEKYLIFKLDSNLSNCFYLNINNIKILFQKSQEKSSITFVSYSKKILNTAVTKFQYNVNDLKPKKIKNILKLKGLGFRCFINKKKTILQLKLGFSHICFIKIPKEIKVKIYKNVKLSFESINVITLGNFISNIIRLKTPDVYKNKGFIRKYNFIHVKSVKKKK